MLQKETIIIVSGFCAISVITGMMAAKSIIAEDNLIKRGDNTPSVNISVKPVVKIDSNKATIIFCDDNLNPKYALSPNGTTPVLLDEYKNAGEPIIYASELLLHRGNIANAFTLHNPQETSTQWYLKKSDGNVITLDGNQVKESRQNLLKITMDKTITNALLSQATQKGR